MNTNMTRCPWFSKGLASECALDESSLRIGRVNKILFRNIRRFVFVGQEEFQMKSFLEIYRFLEIRVYNKCRAMFDCGMRQQWHALILHGGREDTLT